ncbi:hypothetical protein MBLNU230_g0559t1 [Neophaeotheca triangularis]
MEPHDKPVRTKSTSSNHNSIRPRSGNMEAHSTLSGSGATGTKSLPAEQYTSPVSPAASMRSGGSGGSARHSFQSHGRTMSMAADVVNTNPSHGRSNRFSLSFPIQPAREMAPPSPTKHSASSSRETVGPAPDTIAPPTATGPSDSNILTAIAAQERRVLELKEELQRAGKDLELLKKQWATQEAQKKRNDVRKVTKLQPLNTALTVGGGCGPEGSEDAEGSPGWLQQEMDRRKALLSGPKSSSRTVFSGSRHTRTLSLLSPGTVAQRAAVDFPPRQDSLPGKRLSGGRTKQQVQWRQPQEQQQEHQQRARPTVVPRASTTPDLTKEVVENVDAEGDLTTQAVDREALIKGGRQMATHFKDGLWTFFEDLRQATIGDEASQAQHVSSRRESVQSLRSAQKQAGKNLLRSSSRTSTISTGSTETRRPGAKSPLQTRTSPSQTPKAEEPSLMDLQTSNLVHYETLATLEATPARVKKPSSSSHGHAKKNSIHSDDGWSLWAEGNQSPTTTADPSSQNSGASSSATSDSATLPSTNATSARNSLTTGAPETLERQAHSTIGSSSGSKEPLPWPALSKYGPAQLKRTASNLMSEWESTLTQSPGTEYTGQEDYLGLGAEAAASEIGKGVKRD